MKNRRRLKWTLALTLLVIVGAFASTFAFGKRPSLGLDLAGGTAVVLSAPSDTPSENMSEAVNIVRSRTDGLGVAEPEIAVEGGTNIVVQLPGLEDEDRALSVIGTTAELGFRPVQAVLPASVLSDAEQKQLEEETRTERERREKLNPTTTTTTTTTTPADGEAPADGDAEAPAPDAEADPAPPTTTENSAPATAEVRSEWPQLGTAALPAQAPGEDTTPIPPPIDPLTGQEIPVNTTPQVTADPTAGGEPSGDLSLTPRDQLTADEPDPAFLASTDGQVVYQLGPQALSGREVRDASATIDTQGLGGWQVNLQFTGTGDRQYKELTGEAACQPEGDPKRQIAIVLDGRVVSAPAVNMDVQCNAGISGGGIITLGGETPAAQEAEAKDLALKLRYGSLPVRLEISNVQTVSPTLGTDTLVAGLIAGLVGLALVVAYGIFLYRWYGVYLFIQLLVFLMVMYTLFTYLSATAGLTLTLAGLVAIVISLGTNSDSEIVFIERVKDELREGRGYRPAFERGFKRSWRTNVTANTVGLLSAVVLYFLAVGSVRGFALTLGIATLVDLALTWFLTRPMVFLAVNTKYFQKPSRIFWRRPPERGTSGEPVTAAATAGGATA
jgi:preprotein translocase subunit SecD